MSTTTTKKHTLKNDIISTLKNRKRGLTVGEIFTKVDNKRFDRYLSGKTEDADTSYDSVRGRVYELADEGKLVTTGMKKDPESGRVASAFVAA